MKGVSPGAVLVFLMAGPATNIATITVLGNSLGKKATISYLVSIIISSILFGLFIDYFLPAEWFALPMKGNNIHNEMLPEWIKIGSTIILVSLMLNALLKKYGLFWHKENIKNSTLILKVDGLRCNHCKSNVEKNLSKIEGITNVTAILAEKQIHIDGQNINEQAVIKTINDLGYKVID